jgi:hypothetical protein
MTDYEPDRDDYDRIILPDSISQHRDAADLAQALFEFFEGDDRTLGMLANTIQSVCRARWDKRGHGTVDRTRYGSRVTFIDADGEAHTALVMEPDVASMSADEAWDPYHEEYVNPQTAYPLGTVQLVYTPDYNLSDGFNFDRLSGLEAATSVTPATNPDQTYCYYSGWSYALEGGASE